MSAFTFTGCNFKIAEPMTYIRILPGIPHPLQRVSAKHIKTFSPKAACPFHSTKLCISHFCELALPHIDKTISLCHKVIQNRCYYK